MKTHKHFGVRCRTALLLMLMFCFAVVSCTAENVSDNSDTESAAVSDSEITVTVAKSKTVYTGECFALEYEVNGTENTVLPLFTSSVPAVATVDDEGMITARSAGKTDITVSVADSIALMELVVMDKDISISLNAYELYLYVGDTFELVAEIKSEEAFEDTAATFESDDCNTVTVNKDGLLTCIGTGVANITVSIGENTADCVVNVLENVDKIVLDKTNMVLAIGAVATLEASLQPENPFCTVTFTSENEDVAVINDGLITAVGIGETVIKAVAENGITAECVVKVEENAKSVVADSISLSTDVKELKFGESVRIDVSFFPENTYDKRVTFEVSDKNIATVSDEGVVTSCYKGLSVAAFKVTAKVAGGATASIQLSAVSFETSVPAVLGTAYTDDGWFVIVGSCDENSEITARTANQTVTSTADGKYFSVRLASEGDVTSVVLTAVAKGGIESKPLIYEVKKTQPRSDGWGVIAGDSYQFHLKSTVPDYEQTNTLTESELDAFREKMKNRVETVAKISPQTEIIYMFAPNASTVYSDTMPDGYVKGEGESRLQQISSVLREVGITVIDLTDTFNSHKYDDLKIYFKTDSHWTDYGAFLAYTELFDHISNKFEAASPRGFDEFEFIEDYYYGGDLAYYLDIPKESMLEKNAYRIPMFDLPEEIEAVKRYRSETDLTFFREGTPNTLNSAVFETNRPELPSAYIYRDSFGVQLYDILAERFDTTVYKPMWYYAFDRQEIKQYSPDYLIYIFVERNLDEVLGA